MTPAIKYLVCKSAPAFVNEALECFGGNGYSEELPMARYYREAPLNAIWEGSGNVMALDVLRAAARQPDATNEVIDRLARTAGEACDAAGIASMLKRMLRSGEAEGRARFLCEHLARLGAVAALVEAGSPFAGLYAATRLAGPPVAQYGARDLGFRNESTLMERALAV